jgi:hypothetical protein
MPVKAKDPLLAAVQVLLVLIKTFFIFATVMLGIGIGALLTVGRTEVLARIAAAGAPSAAYWLLLAAITLIMGLLMLGYRFFKELGGVINSVGAGDPFRADNATRLGRMGWISVGAHALGLLIGAMVTWFAPYIHKVGGHSDMGFGIDGGGVLLTLILFILARVFREGSQMREELEGTV